MNVYLSQLIKLTMLQQTMEDNPKSKCKHIATLVLVSSLVLLSIVLVPKGQTGTSFADTARELYTTGVTRLAVVSKYCAVSPVSIGQSQRDINQIYNSSLSTYFKANATKLISSLLNSRLGDFFVELQVSGIGTFVFVSPFLVGLALLLLSWPFFLCCCICQDDCPAKCCRSRNTHYAPGELNWVTVFLVLTALLIAATAIPSLTNASGYYFSDFNCRAAQFMDNFRNGNQTSNQLYFYSGISTVRQQFSNVLSPALTSVATQITKIAGLPTSALDTAKTDAATAKTSLQTMPNGGNTLQFSLNYNYPLQSSASTGTMASVVGPSVGTFGASSTLLGSVYSEVNALQANLTSITTAASGVAPHLSAADMGAHISAADTILSQVETSFNGIELKLQDIMAMLANVDSYNSKYSFALYGTVMGMGVMVLVGVILVKCFDAISCRHCLWLLCFISFFLALLLLVFAVGLAVAMTTTYYTCIYLSDAFTSPTTFTSVMNTLVGSSGDVSTYFSQCFGGSNDFLTRVDPTLSGYVSQLKTAVFGAALYNFTYMTASLNTRLSSLSTAIDQAGLGQVPDFSPSSAEGQAQMAYFRSVADKSLFTSCPSGSYPVFWQDAWVPGHSTTYQGYVGCQGKVAEDATVCSSGISSTASCPSSRCIDTFSIINKYYRSGSIATLVTDANTRYGSACTPFNDYLTNFFNNYVKPVADTIGNSGQDSADNSKLAGRYNSKAKTQVEALRDQMNNFVKPLFTEVYGNLTSTLSLDSIFNPETGVITGLDCRVMSESGVNLKEGLCVRSFNRMFFSLVTVGIMSFGMFLMVCCILCFNVRHYQFHIQNTRTEARVFPLDETDSAIKME